MPENIEVIDGENLKTDYLNGKSGYLAGPIADVDDDGIGWREFITPRLKEFGIIVEDPTKKSFNGMGEVKDDKAYFKRLAKEKRYDDLKEVFWPIVRKDLRTVDKVDFLIAVYNPKVRMLGTIHELVIAQNQRKPILLYCKEEWIDEDFNPWILTFVKKGNFFTNWDDLFAKLKDVNDGNFDYNFWTL